MSLTKTEWEVWHRRQCLLVSIYSASNNLLIDNLEESQPQAGHEELADPWLGTQFYSPAVSKQVHMYWHSTLPDRYNWSLKLVALTADFLWEAQQMESLYSRVNFNHICTSFRAYQQSVRGQYQAKWCLL